MVGWFAGVGDFQSNLRFGSKLADRVENLQKKVDFMSALLLGVEDAADIQH